MMTHQLTRQTATNESLKLAREPGQRTVLGVSRSLGVLCFVFVAVTSALAAETNVNTTYWQASGAASRLDTLLAKAASVSNVTATLEVTVTPTHGYPPSKYPYYRSIPTGMTRIEVLETRRTIESVNSTVVTQVSSIVDYAMLIDENDRKVYAQSNGRLAVFDAQSAGFWLSVADMLSGKSSTLGSSRDRSVYYVGSETVDNAKTEGFILQTKPSAEQMLWVGIERGLVYRARQNNVTCQLAGVKTNTGLKEDLFALDVKGKEIPEISQMQLSQWQASTLLPPSTQSPPQSEVKSSAIHIAAWAGNLKAVKEFLATNPQLVNAKEEHGWTPLHLAAMCGYKEMVTLVLDSGAEVNTKDTRERTALYFAALHGKKDVVGLLVEHKAVVNVRDKESGLTPLLGAVMGGYGEVVELLLKNGADWTVKDSNGQTALQTATTFGRKDVAELLRRYGETE